MKPAIAISLCLALTACASAPEPPPRIAQGISENQRGLAQLAKGEHAKALAHFQQALEIATSLEDLPAMAANLLNIARTERQSDQPQAAKASLRRLLYAQSPAFPKKFRIEAAYEASTLCLETDERQEARQFLQKGQELCGSSCQALGQLLGVRAHLALIEGDSKQALRDAQTAVRLLREEKAPEQLANALRTQALALLAMEQPGQAPALLEEALSLDKKRGASRAIFKDLLILGQAWQAKEASQSAKEYYRRALNVAKADGYEIGIAQASEALAGIR